MKPKMLIISAVYPYPRHSGQQQRVYYKLKALREGFHLTFLTVSPSHKTNEVQSELESYVDEAIVLPSRYLKSVISRYLHRLIGFINTLFTGLKFSNYLIGNLEFPYSRVSSTLDLEEFEMVLFEYWHAHKTARKMKKNHVITILDMHDLLWQSYNRQLDAKKWLPRFIKRSFAYRYKKREENAWGDFDVLIAINKAEMEYTQQFLGEQKKLLYAPMGTDVSAWQYCWLPEEKPRSVAYYGSLGGAHNQRDAMLCYKEIMPLIWQRFPEIEFWIVGSNPPDFIRDLSGDPKVHVTGFVEDVKEILKTMSLVLCPWSGTFGFRSRVVEVMALGVPVVASEDAVYGMDFEINKGICVGETPVELAQLANNWLSQKDLLHQQSMLARHQIEEKFSYEVTYGQLSKDLMSFLR